VDKTKKRLQPFLGHNRLICLVPGPGIEPGTHGFSVLMSNIILTLIKVNIPIFYKLLPLTDKGNWFTIINKNLPFLMNSMIPA
jgi:hypothetical protein